MWQLTKISLKYSSMENLTNFEKLYFEIIYFTEPISVACSLKIYNIALSETGSLRQ